jgi:hypothetical protein
VILYGDIFILKSDYTDITISDYSVFYSNQFENYSDYDSDTTISEEDNISDIENDNLDEEYEIINEGCEGLAELEYDNNDY